MRPDNRFDRLLFGTVVVAVVALAGWRLIDRNASPSREDPLPTEPVSVAGASMMGSPSAQVVMIEFSEFQCPYCGQYARELAPQLIREFVLPGKVRLAFRHLPLDSIHPRARMAAEAAVCAGELGEFWAAHDFLFASQPGLLTLDLGRSFASFLKIDPDSFERCMQSELPRTRVRQDEAEARKVAVSGTPSFLVGYALDSYRVRVTKRFSGVPQPDRLRAALSEALLVGSR